MTESETTPRLFVATPAYGGLMHAQYVRSLLKLMDMSRSVGWRDTYLWTASGESLIQRARNDYVAEFLKSDCTHLLSIDADISFDPRAVPNMLASGHDVVCCIYPRKVVNWDAVRKAALLYEPDLQSLGCKYAFNIDFGEVAARDQHGVAFDAVNGCVPVKDAATGFLLTSRKAIVDMCYAHPETLYRSNHDQSRYESRFALFDCEICPETGFYLSEDFTFSRRWQRMGGKVWAYVGPYCDLTHVGSYDYAGRIHTYLQPVGADHGETESSLPDDNGAYAIIMRERYEWAARALVGANRIADACSGPGYGMPVLRRHGASVVGFDRNPENLRLCIANDFGEVKLVDDVQAENFDGFDALCTIETIEHLPDPIGWLRRLSPTVNRLVLSCPCIPTKHRNKYHLHDFGYDEVLNIVRALGWTTKDHRRQKNDDAIWLYAERNAA